MLTGKLDILQETRALSVTWIHWQSGETVQRVNQGFIWKRWCRQRLSNLKGAFYKSWLPQKNDSLELRLILVLCAINHQIINFLQHSSDPFNNSRIYIYSSLITIWYLSHSRHNVMQFALHSVGLIRHGLTRRTFKTYSSSRIKHAAHKSISKSVKLKLKT